MDKGKRDEIRAFCDDFFGPGGVFYKDGAQQLVDYLRAALDELDRLGEANPSLSIVEVLEFCMKHDIELTINPIRTSGSYMLRMRRDGHVVGFELTMAEFMRARNAAELVRYALNSMKDALNNAIINWRPSMGEA